MADPSPHKTSGALSEDAVLKATLENVALPAGLAARLKARIRTQYETPSSANLATAIVDVRPDVLPMSAGAQAAHAPVTGDRASAGSLASAQQSDAEQAHEQQTGWLRRSILVAAVAASICGFALLARQWSRPAEPRWLASQCDSILVQIDADNPANWQAVAPPMPATLQRAQSQLVRVATVAERSLTALGSKLHGKVYRLDAGDGRGIYLMRLEALPAVRGLTSRFEILPTPSGGWSLAAMTVGQDTFVLAANCTEQQIFTYIRRPDLT